MSATELDLPVLISPEQIRRREFVTTRRGYDPGQVRDYLEALADQVNLMSSMIRDARAEADTLLRNDAGPKPDPYDQLARRVAGVIRSADEAAERFRVEARRDAEATMEQARADAERIRSEAKAAAEEARAHAERALGEAKEQADRTIAGLSTRREALVEQLAEMRERLLGVAEELEATIVDPPPPPRDDAATADQGPNEPAAATMPAGPSMDGPLVRLVDTPAPPPRPEAVSIETLFADLGEPSVQEELWEGSDDDELEPPEIPPLDLDWGPDLDEDDFR